MIMAGQPIGKKVPLIKLLNKHARTHEKNHNFESTLKSKLAGNVDFQTAKGELKTQLSMLKSHKRNPYFNTSDVLMQLDKKQRKVKTEIKWAWLNALIEHPQHNGSIMESKLIVSQINTVFEKGALINKKFFDKIEHQYNVEFATEIKKIHFGDLKSLDKFNDNLRVMSVGLLNELKHQKVLAKRRQPDLTI